MSGHNKWSQIKRQKEVSDTKKSREFSKLARLISLESKKGGGNIDSPGLKTTIEKARKANMPNDNITRAIEKGRGDEVATLETVTYETYGPGGVALLIEGLTDNRNRSGAEIKHLLSGHGLTLAAPGSAAWAFARQGTAWKPTSIITLSLTDKETLATLIAELRDRDDVQEVYDNAE